MTASGAALVSFQEQRGTHEGGVDVRATQVERAAEVLGAEIAFDERQQLEPLEEVAPTTYLGMHATGVPTRAEEVADRAAKQPDSSAKTREAMLVTRAAESHDAQDKAGARFGIGAI